MSAVEQPVWGDVSNALHIERLRHFARVGIGEVLRREGALAVVTGAMSNIENGVVSESADVDPGVAAELVEWTREHEVPASWAAEVDVGERLHEALVGLGCREETTGVDMGARLAELELSRTALNVELEDVLDREALRAWIDVADSTGLFDDGDVKAGQELLYARVGLGTAPFRHWLARRDGHAVGMATGFFHGGAALLEHIAVRPDAQRSGVGTALVARWRRDADRAGCDVGVLGPTPDSQGFYERLGFTLSRVRPRRWYYL